MLHFSEYQIKASSIEELYSDNRISKRLLGCSWSKQNLFLTGLSNGKNSCNFLFFLVGVEDSL